MIFRWLKKYKKLQSWKDEKRKKWLAEGRDPKEIERELKKHRLYLRNLFK